jgi:serine/threonine-protein kinase ULK/ATG1
MRSIKNEVEQYLLNNEIKVLRKLNNLNCLKVFDILQTVNNTYIITEFCN